MPVLASTYNPSPINIIPHQYERVETTGRMSRVTASGLPSGGVNYPQGTRHLASTTALPHAADPCRCRSRPTPG